MKKKLTSGRSMQAQSSQEEVDVLASAVHAMQEAGRLGKAAEAGDDLRTSIHALDRYIRAAELVAKLQENRSTETGDIGKHPDFLRLLQRIIQALEPHPEARDAVERALMSSTDVA
jgi:hypothetical protein